MRSASFSRSRGGVCYGLFVYFTSSRANHGQSKATSYSTAQLFFWLILGITGMARGQQAVRPAQAPSDAVAVLRQSIIDGPYGRMPIEELVQHVPKTQGYSLERAYLALALRKEEALPVVLETLRAGPPQEQRAMTKVLRYLGWSEAVPALIEVATSDTGHPLARTGSLYALGAIGDQAAGPALVRALQNAQRSLTEKGVTIAALARLGFRDAIPHIRPLTTHANIHLRLFALRAMAELGEDCDTKILVQALNHNDYLVRQEACAALGAVGRQATIAKLNEVADTDHHSSVRREAQIAILRITISKQPLAQRVNLLEQALVHKDGRIASWAISTLATRCGDQGRAVLREQAKQNSRIGHKSSVSLLMSLGASSRFRGRY